MAASPESNGLGGARKALEEVGGGEDGEGAEGSAEGVAEVGGVGGEREEVFVAGDEEVGGSGCGEVEVGFVAGVAGEGEEVGYGVGAEGAVAEFFEEGFYPDGRQVGGSVGDGRMEEHLPVFADDGFTEGEEYIAGFDSAEDLGGGAVGREHGGNDDVAVEDDDRWVARRHGWGKGVRREVGWAVVGRCVGLPGWRIDLVAGVAGEGVKFVFGEVVGGGSDGGEEVVEGKLVEFGGLEDEFGDGLVGGMGGAFDGAVGFFVEGDGAGGHDGEVYIRGRSGGGYLRRDW